jgi:hypothetical protein
MKTTKLLAAILTIVFLTGMFGALRPVYALADLGLSPTTVTWDTSSHAVNDQFTLQLIVSNIASMYGYQYQINWDNAVVNLVSVHDTVPLPGSPFLADNTTTPGQMTFTITSISGSGVTGTFTLRSMVFKAVQAPPHTIGGHVTTTFAITNDILGAPDATAIPHTTTNSVFTFNFVAPAAPTITAGSFSTAAPGTFTIPVTVAAYDPIYALTSVHFNLIYDASKLTATGATAGTWGGVVTFSIASSDIAVDVTGVIPVGASGVVANIAFNGFFNPGPGNVATSLLTLSGANFNGGTAFSAVHNGLYTIAVPSLAQKAIYASPMPLVGTDEGETLVLKIAIANVTSVDQIFGIQFTLSYDPSLLQVVGVSEGPFFSNFQYLTPPATYFFVYPGGVIPPPPPPTPGQFTVAQGLLGGGAAPPGYLYPFTVNNLATDHDVVAYVTFVTQAGIPGATVSSPLPLSNVIFGNVAGLPISVGLVHDGLYTLTEARQYLDVYTNYPAPYGGQLRFHDSDSFAPQDLVTACVYLTYNRYPVMNKPVAIEIDGPINSDYNITVYRTIFTDDTGHACMTFRIEWPSSAKEMDVLGIWTVTARADVDGVEVVDVLHFMVGWLVQVDKITLFPQDNFNHGYTVEAVVDYHVIHAQPIPVIFTVSFFDEVGNAMGSMIYATSVASPGIMMTGYGSIDVVGFVIPIFARAGVGIVYADAYTADPTFAHGVPYCPEISTPIIINAA